MITEKKLTTKQKIVIFYNSEGTHCYNTFQNSK